MQISDLTVSHEMRTSPVAFSFPAAVSDFFRLLGEVTRGDGEAAQASPASTDDSGAPSGGSVASETPADPSTGLRTDLQETTAIGAVVRPGSPQTSDDGRDGTVLDQNGTALILAFLADLAAQPFQPVVPLTPFRTDPSTGLRTDLQETTAIGAVVRPGSPQTSDDGRDGTVLDQSDTALALGFLTGTVAFEGLVEGPRVALMPARADVCDPTALSLFSEAAEEATPIASIRAQADQRPHIAEPQGIVGHSSSLTGTLSAVDVTSFTSVRVAEEPSRGPGEGGSTRLAPQGRFEATVRGNEAAPLEPVLRAVEGSGRQATGVDGRVQPFVGIELPAQRPILGRIARTVLTRAEGPVLSGSAPLTTGDSALLTTGSVEGSARQSSTAPELLAPQPAIGYGEGPVLSGSAPLTTGLVEGGSIAPRLSTESAGLPMAASDETANSGEGATAITVSHDRPDGTAMEERPQPAAQLGALRDRPGVGQERPGSGSESEDESFGMSSAVPGSDHGHDSGPSFGEVSSTRADAPRPGASAVAERDRSLTLQVTQQIVAAARFGFREDKTSVRLRLHPESLGELLIKISWKEKGIVAAIQAESPVAARMLQEDLGHLKAALGERGIAVNDLGVQVSVDLRHGRAYGDRLPETTTSRVVQEARPWRPRDEALPLASLIQREGLIDIRV